MVSCSPSRNPPLRQRYPFVSESSTVCGACRCGPLAAGAITGAGNEKKKGTVRIVSHLPEVTAAGQAGRHRAVGTLASCTSAVAGIVAPTWARWTTPRHSAPAPRSLVAGPGAHALTARHQRRSRRRRSGPPRGFVTTVGFAVAAAPWTLVFFAPASAGAQAPSLASQ